MVLGSMAPLNNSSNDKKDDNDINNNIMYCKTHFYRI